MKRLSYFERVPFLMLMVFIMIACSGKLLSAQTGQMYQNALSLISSGQYTKGIKAYYKFLLAYDPLLSVESRRNDLAEAIAFLRTSAAQKLSETELKLSQVILDRILLNLSEAQTSIETLTRLHPNTPLLEFMNGEFFLAGYEIEKAVQSFMKLRRMPRADALNAIAKIIIERNGIDSDAFAKKAGLMKRAFRHIDLMEQEEGEAILRQILIEYPSDIEASVALIDLCSLAFYSASKRRFFSR